MGQALLAGVRVLDFTALLPGPFGTGILADLGADVVKVEPPQGEFGRAFPTKMFAVANRNKRSICIDLKNPAARPVIARLARWADIAAEAFRPGVAARLGIGAATLRAEKPALVYVSLSGYGQNGPWRDIPGHDFNYLAGAGALSFKGHWDDARPRRSGLPVADLSGGCFLAIAALAALMRARATGEGATLDVSLLEASMSFMAVREGLDIDTPGRQHLHPTNDVFTTADGQGMALGIVEDHFWAAFVAAARDLDERLADPRFDREPDRRTHGDELHALIAGAMAQCTAEAWLARFVGHDVPAQRVLTPREAADAPHAQARGLIQQRDGERHLPFPALLDGEPASRLDRLAPDLGIDRDDVLRELGFDLVRNRHPCRERRGTRPRHRHQESAMEFSLITDQAIAELRARIGKPITPGDAGRSIRRSTSMPRAISPGRSATTTRSGSIRRMVPATRWKCAAGAAMHPVFHRQRGERRSRGAAERACNVRRHRLALARADRGSAPR